MNKEEQEFKEEMERARLTGEPYFTATQKQFLNCADTISKEDLEQSIKTLKEHDCILSLQKPNFFVNLWQTVKMFFYRTFKIKNKHDLTIIRIHKNRARSGSSSMVVNFDKKQIN